MSSLQQMNESNFFPSDMKFKNYYVYICNLFLKIENDRERKQNSEFVSKNNRLNF